MTGPEYRSRTPKRSDRKAQNRQAAPRPERSSRLERLLNPEQPQRTRHEPLPERPSRTESPAKSKGSSFLERLAGSEGTPRTERTPVPDRSLRQTPLRHAGESEHSSRSSKVKPKRGTGPAIALAVLGIVFAIIFGVVFGGWYMLVRSPGPTVEPGQEVAVIIPEGAGVAVIADILVEKGIIANPTMFKIMVRMKSEGALFHAGRYMLITGSGYDAAIAALTVPPPPVDVVNVTIIEGLRIDQVARSVAAQLGVSAVEFEDRASNGAEHYAEKYPYLAGSYENSLEGFLFPDTYEFATDATVDDVIERMLARFDEVFTSIEVPASRLERYQIHELVTIASLVEREASIAEERPLVASVIDNRFDQSMMLQFCSTVQFLLPPERLTDLRLSDADTKISSPYNTYINAGLPPGPICSPSKSSLLAAVNPAQTDYLYFVLTSKTGEQTFSRTFEEHNAATRISQEVFGQ